MHLSLSADSSRPNRWPFHPCIITNYTPDNPDSHPNPKANRGCHCESDPFGGGAIKQNTQCKGFFLSHTHTHTALKTMVHAGRPNMFMTHSSRRLPYFFFFSHVQLGHLHSHPSVLMQTNVLVTECVRVCTLQPWHSCTQCPTGQAKSVI